MWCRRLLSLAIGAVLGAGCSDEASSVDKNEAVVTIANVNRTYAELSPNDLVVRVNGAELTKGEVERQIAFRLAMSRMRPGVKADARREARQRAQMQRTCDQQFILQELMRGYAISNGVKVTSEDRSAMRERLVKTYTRNGSYAKIVGALSNEDKAILADGVDRELWVMKGREKMVADNLKPIADDEVAKRRAYFEKYNERATAAVAKTWQDATNIWKKATGGYPFEKLVEMYADGKVEHVSSDAAWGDLKASDYKDDPGLYKVLTTTPEGVVPFPFEGDNGVLVVKMLKITPANPEKGQPEPLYRLAKVFLELPEVWDVESDEELRADIVKIHEREAYQKGIKALINASKVEYPNGTNLFPRPPAVRRSQIPAAARNRLPRGMKLPE